MTSIRSLYRLHCFIWLFLLLQVGASTSTNRPRSFRGGLLKSRKAEVAAAIISTNKEGRQLQVTGALDWQKNTEASSLANSTAATEQKPTTATAGSSLKKKKKPTQDDDNDIVITGKSPSFGSKLLAYLLTAAATVGVVIGVVVIVKNREMARWHEYRTHQLLQAQDEAFDLDFDEEDAFDLELVEGISGINTHETYR
jgi:hypothetical protein